MPLSPHMLLAQCIRESKLGLMDSAAVTAGQLLSYPSTASNLLFQLDVRTRLIWIRFQSGAHELALDIARIAITDAIALGDKVRESLARSFYARVLAEGPEVVAAADEVVTALKLARLADNPLARSVALVNLAVICSRLALYEAAVDMVREAVTQAELSGDEEAYAHAVSNYGSLHADYLYRYSLVADDQKEKYLDLAIEQSTHAREFAYARDDGEMARLSGYNLVEFLLMRGDQAAAEVAWQRVESAPGMASRRSQVQRGHVWALLLLGRGKADALEALEESLERCLAYPFPELALFASENRSRLLEEAGRYDEAYREHKRFHALYCIQNNQNHREHIQYKIIIDQVEELRALAKAENERAARLEQEHARLRTETALLARESLEDGLTGLANRRRFEEILAACANAGHTYAIAILDLDHFKQINDQFSHRVGDAVLRQVGAILRSTLGDYRKPSLRVAARLGGEEFAIVLMDDTQPVQSAVATAICEAIRTAIAAYDWGQQSDDLAVTTSIGLAMSYEATDNAGRLALADARLYDAKHAGRNRLHWNDEWRNTKGELTS